MSVRVEKLIIKANNILMVLNIAMKLLKMREGCVGHEVALPLVAKYEQPKDCRSDSEARNSPTRSVKRVGTP